MPCACTEGLCRGTCVCAKAGSVCGPACHGGKGHKGNSACVNFSEAIAVAALSAPEVRKELARAGLDVIGNANELRRRLGDHRISAGGASGAGGAGPGGIDALIAAVLARADDPAALLSLGAGGAVVSAATPEAELRRAYLRLSLKVHPDKNGGSAESKAAFQALVSALERIVSMTVDAGAGASSAPRSRVDTSVARSNDGCVQTRIECPRCAMDWPRAELGLEAAAYDWLMTAVREYTCGRCCLSFGCMTAVHKCPGCQKPFNYSPSLFHRKVTCGSCKRIFGFLQHPVSTKRLAEVRVELAAAQEERMRRADARARRDGRAAARDDGACGGPLGREALFELELLDACPRCGADCAADDSPLRTAHLAGCNDAAAHARAAAAAARARAAVATAAARADGAADTMALAGWDARGRVLGALWALPRGALASLCAGDGLATDGDRVALIKRYRAAAVGRGEQLLLEDAKDSGGGGGAGAGAGAPRASSGSRRVDAVGIAGADAHELPRHAASLDAEQLAAVCAAFGLQGDVQDGKAALLRVIECSRFSGREEAVGLLRDEDGRVGGYLEDAGSEDDEEDEEDDGGGESDGSGKGGAARAPRRKRARAAQ